MKQGPKNLSRKLNQTQVKINGNARAYKEFGCPATSAPTPPVSVSDDWKAGVGADLLNNQTVGAGVGVEEVKIKIKDELQHRGNPPLVSLTGRAGFSTPFPGGMTPSGSFIFKTYISGGRP